MHPLPEYPRPSMRRDSYVNLNGPWDYAITQSSEFPAKWDGAILVPYSPEAKASGVGRTLQPGQWLHYHRTFMPPAGEGGRVLLHFGAVDYACAVEVNGRLAGGHRGGYWPFTLDITDLLRPQGRQVHQHHAGIDIGTVLVHVQTQLIETVQKAADMGGRRKKRRAHRHLIQLPQALPHHDVRVEIQHPIQRVRQIFGRKNTIVNGFWVAVGGRRVRQTVLVHLYQVQFAPLSQQRSCFRHVRLRQSLVVQQVHVKIRGTVTVQCGEQHHIQLRNIVPIQCHQQVHIHTSTFLFSVYPAFTQKSRTAPPINE